MPRRPRIDPLPIVLVAGGLLLILKGRGGEPGGGAPYKTNSAAALHPDFRAKLDKVMARLRAKGFNPAIAVSWRNRAWQAKAKADGRSALDFSLHNVTSPSGKPAALAADIVQSGVGWPSGTPETNPTGWHAAGAFFQALRDASVAEGLRSGGNFNQSNAGWARYGLGWDPAHVEAVAATPARRAALKRGDFAAAGVRQIA